MADKQQFLDSLIPIEQLPLFLADSINQLSEQIQINCIQLSIPAKLQIESQELVAFLKRVKQNRQIQLQDSSLTTNLIYYIWHDELAGQLRFNFINSLHDKLPFGAAISLVESEIEIISDFLNSKYLQGLAWKDFTTDDEMPAVAEDSTATAFTLKVYQEIIFHSAIHHPESFR